MKCRFSFCKRCLLCELKGSYLHLVLTITLCYKCDCLDLDFLEISFCLFSASPPSRVVIVLPWFSLPFLLYSALVFFLPFILVFVALWVFASIGYSLFLNLFSALETKFSSRCWLKICNYSIQCPRSRLRELWCSSFSLSLSQIVLLFYWQQKKF